MSGNTPPPIPPGLPADPLVTHKPEARERSLRPDHTLTTGPQWVLSVPGVPADPAGQTGEPVPSPGGGSSWPSLDTCHPTVDLLAQSRASLSPEGHGAPVFELRHLVGRGGMGEVWSALQTSLKRPVAVKTLRADAWQAAAADPEVLERLRAEFEQEALTGAQLDHPNIVPVHDLGTGPGGRPLLAMKLVEGESWAHMLQRDAKEMEPQDLLAKHIPILIEVTQAVAFAHSKGIVHRDLKPSQVMTGSFGETLLMDWGLAVFCGEKGGPLPAPSEFPPLAVDLPTPATAGSPAGTPALMAPEQTHSSAENVGTWTDVYLLGGTLYCLLTGGAYPHDASSSQMSMFHAAMGTVDPPSSRTPGRYIPAELEELAMQALAAEPDDRVPSARAFLERLQDFLTGAGRRRESEEVTALATREFGELEEARRAGRLDAQALYLGQAAVADRLTRALELWPGNMAARRLRAENLQARIAAEIEQGDLVLARVHLQQCRAAGTTETGVLDALQRRIDEADRRRALHRRQRLVFLWSACFLFLCAIGFAVVSRVNALRARKAEAESTAQALQAEDARSEAADLSRFMLDDLRKQLEPVARLDVMDSVLDRVNTHLQAHRSFESLPQKLQKAKLQLAVSEVRFAQGRMKEADEAAARALEVARELPGGRQDTEPLALVAQAHIRRADALTRLGRLPEALAEAGDARAVLAPQARREPPPINVLKWMAEALNRTELIAASQGDAEKAEKANEEAHALLTRLAALEPANHAWQRELATNRNNLGNLRRSQGRKDEMKTCFEDALAMRERLVESEPGNAEFRRDLSASHLNLASVYATQGKADDAQAEIEKSLRIHERLAADDPTNLLLQGETAVIDNNLGNFLHQRGDEKGAQAAFERSVQIGTRLHEVRPDNSDWHFNLALARGGLGMALSALGRPDEAAADYASAIDDLGTLSRSDPTNIPWRRILARTHESVADLQLRAAKFDEATSHSTTALDIRDKVRRENPRNWNFWGEVVKSCDQLSSIHRLAGHPDLALEVLRRRLELATARNEADTSKVAKLLVPESNLRLAAALFQSGNQEEARSLLESTGGVLRQALSTSPGDPGIERLHGAALSLLARLESSSGGAERAAALAQQAVATLKPFAKPGDPASCAALGEALRILGRRDEAVAAVAGIRDRAWQDPDVADLLRELDSSGAR